MLPHAVKTNANTSLSCKHYTGFIIPAAEEEDSLAEPVVVDSLAEPVVVDSPAAVEVLDPYKVVGQT